MALAWWASVAALAGTALGGLLVGPGCASSPPVDRLRVAIELNNAAVASLDAARAEHRKAVADDFARRAAACGALEPGARPACLVEAARATKAAAAPEAARLAGLVLLEQTAAEALAAAKQCRDDKLGCEAEQLRAAASPLAQVRAGLALEADVDAGAEGGAGEGGAR